MIAGPFGPVPLSQVARIAPTETPLSVSPMTAASALSPSPSMSWAAALQATVDDAKAKVAALKLPPGVYVEFTGAAAAQTASRNQLLLYTAFALVLIGMILFICFNWRANTWLVLVNLPFSLIGSVAAIALIGVGPVGGRHGRAGDGVRHQRPQRHPAAGPLRTSGGSRRRALERRDRAARARRSGWCPS